MEVVGTLIFPNGEKIKIFTTKPQTSIVLNLTDEEIRYAGIPGKFFYYSLDAQPLPCLLNHVPNGCEYLPQKDIQNEVSISYSSVTDQEAIQAIWNGQIQKYLNKIGVYHFTEEDIKNYPFEDQLFWLTNFHGAYSTNYKSLAWSRMLFKSATSDMAKTIAKKSKLECYLQTNFTLAQELFNEINQTNSIDHAMKVLGCTSEERLLNSFFEYCNIFNQPRTDFNLYNDLEIQELCGILPGKSKSELNSNMRNILSHDNFILLTKQYSKYFINKVSIISGVDFTQENSKFIGKGSINKGYNCYLPQELIAVFDDSQKDGFLIFSDLENYPRQFTTAELFQLSKLNSDFRKYAEISQIQDVDKEQTICRFRNFPDKDLLRNIFLSYIHMGMYMRQWNGPGTPYPLFKNQTGNEAPADSELAKLIEERVFEEGVKLCNYVRQLPSELEELFWSLRIYYVNSDKDVIIFNETIKNRYDSLIYYQCIRVTSAAWIFTGIFYFKHILKEIIPELDVIPDSIL